MIVFILRLIFFLCMPRKVYVSVRTTINTYFGIRRNTRSCALEEYLSNSASGRYYVVLRTSHKHSLSCHWVIIHQPCAKDCNYLLSTGRRVKGEFTGTRCTQASQGTVQKVGQIWSLLHSGALSSQQRVTPKELLFSDASKFRVLGWLFIIFVYHALNTTRIYSSHCQPADFSYRGHTFFKGVGGVGPLLPHAFPSSSSACRIFWRGGLRPLRTIHYFMSFTPTLL